MELRSDYLWLEHFWGMCLTRRPGIRWEVASLVSGDVDVRDGLSLSLVREQLLRRNDVRYRYVQALTTPLIADDIEKQTNFLLIGRPHFFAASPRFTRLAAELGSNAFGSFLDSRNSRSEAVVRYGDRTFRRHEIAPAADYRRYDQDYGFLLCRNLTVKGEKHFVIALAGLGILGTLGLTVILTDDKRRQQLVQQVRELHPVKKPSDSYEHVEIGVRISVGGNLALVNLLNDIAQGKEGFTFQVEVVASGREGEESPQPQQITVRESPAVAVNLSTLETIFTEGLHKARKAPQQFQLLRKIIEAPAAATKQSLCQSLGYLPKRPKRLPGEKEYRLLAKLAFDINKKWEKWKERDRLPVERLVHFNKKQGIYYLDKHVRLTL